MIATITMSNGTTKAATGTWGSDNTSVATVNESGLVTGIAPGDATIYIDTNGTEILDAMGSVTGMENLDSSGIEKIISTANLRGTKTLTVRNIWSKSGKGNSAFDMPTYISRVRIIGEVHYGDGDFFTVYIAGKVIIEEWLGEIWGQTIYDGTFITNGGQVQITRSSSIEWSFTEVPRTDEIY